MGQPILGAVEWVKNFWGNTFWLWRQLPSSNRIWLKEIDTQDQLFRIMIFISKLHVAIFTFGKNNLTLDTRKYN